MANSVAGWLDQLGLGQYTEAFSGNAIEWVHLPDLDHETLQALGVDAVGHRMTIIKAATALTPSTTPDPSASTAESFITTGPSDAERRQLTVMFCSSLIFYPGSTNYCLTTDQSYPPFAIKGSKSYSLPAAFSHKS